MKPIKEIILLQLLVSATAFGQPASSCTNADFEMGNFNSWIGKTGWCYPITMNNTGFVAGRHTIMSPGGVDPYSLGLIPFVPNGFGNHTVRLGNDNVGSEAEQLIYDFSVTPNNALFIYRYAVVLEDPGHNPADQPRFTINVFDQQGVAVQCGTYNVVSSANIPGFVNNMDYRIKPWTTVGIDLSAYIGQNVRIEFTTADCGLGGHFGYAYMECYCSPFQIFSDYCPGMTTATLQAPVGFASYLWSTGATTSSITISNPVNGTSYSVTMTSVTGCQVTLTSVLAQASLFANFYLTTFCSNHVSFIDSSWVAAGSPIAQWHWDFGDSTTSNQHFPIHSYADSGAYNVQLIVTNYGGCSDTITIPIQTQPVPQSDFGFVAACPGSPVSFIDSSAFVQGNITDWYWDFGDGDSSAIQNPSHTYSNALIHTVLLITTASNGCTDTAAITVSSLPVPQAAFATQNKCVNTPALFADGSYVSTGTITGWHWSFGDGTSSSVEDPTHIYTTTGSFTVTLIVTASSGCTDTVVHTVNVRPLPVANFSTVPACLGSAVQFHDNSTVSVGNISSRHWYYGDGDSLYGGVNTSHLYDSSGIFNASLVVISNYGCRDTITLPVEQMFLPVAAFANTPACPNTTVLFSDSSYLQNGSIAQWEWDFNDNSSIEHIQNPAHLFPGGIGYFVQLIVTGTNGCVDSITLPVVMQAAPIANFTTLPVCPGVAMSFVDSSSFINGSVTGWSWDFGDGSNPMLTQYPQHAYTVSGIYQVALHVLASNGCFADTVLPVEVFPRPVPGFTSNDACIFDTLHFLDNSFVSSGNIVSWSWQVDGTVMSSLQNISLSFSDLLQHPVNLIVETDHGCIDSSFNLAQMNPLPTAKMKLTDGCFPGTTSFMDASYVQNGVITSWQWDFEDSTPVSNLYAPVHAFPGPGNYEINLTVFTNHGCKAMVTDTAVVWLKPTTDFLPDIIEGCEPLEVQFRSQSFSLDGEVASWNWNFGNGITDTAADVSTVFQNSGTYSVVLIITSDHGCTDTAFYQNLLTVYPKPTAGFSLTPSTTNIYDPTVSFFDSSMNAVSWYWDFDDGMGSTELNPVHVYLEAGLFDVKQIVTSDRGCKDTMHVPVDIKPEYMYVIPNAFTPNDDGVNDSFIGQGIGVKEFTMYIFNRWGERIYETTDQTAAWNGRYNGSNAQEDVYVYKIALTDAFQKYHEFIGKVTLIRGKHEEE